MKKKAREFIVGDLVLFKEAKHHWGSGPGSLRDSGLPLLEGKTGEITNIRTGYGYKKNKATGQYEHAPKNLLYSYYVKFVVKTVSGKELTYRYAMAQDELELVFGK